jgi:hypothetical protein
MYTNKLNCGAASFFKRASFLNMILLSVLLFSLGACHNDTDVKAPEMPKDSVATGGRGSGTKDSSASGSSGVAKDSVGYISGTKRLVDTSQLTANLKIKKAGKDNAKHISKSVSDTLGKGNVIKDNTTVQKPDVDKAAAVVQRAAAENNPPAGNTDHFVSKYGVIPRNATENNITSFLNAFPDKTILVKINFDATPDAEMNAVKAQIIKVLRASGYTNVADQSGTLEPIRMPKEIHYELQRNGSVVIWVQPANE